MTTARARVRSLAARFRSRAADPTVNALALVLSAGVLLDFATTTVILLDPAYSEGNEFLLALESVHVALPLAYNLAFGTVLVLAYVFLGGWLGRVGAAMAATSFFLGVNNLVYFAAGDPTLLDVLFGDALAWVLAYGIALFGVVVATVWHVARERSLPLVQTVAVGAIWIAVVLAEEILILTG